MLLPQDARRNKLVCFGIVLADFPCSFIYVLEFGFKWNVGCFLNDILCTFTSLQRYMISHSDSSDRDRVSRDSLRPLPSESVCPRRFLPPLRPVRRSGGPAAPAAWSSILGRARAGQ